MSDMFSDDLFESFFTKKKKEPSPPAQEKPELHVMQESKKRNCDVAEEPEPSQPTKKKHSKKKPSHSPDEDKNDADGCIRNAPAQEEPEVHVVQESKKRKSDVTDKPEQSQPTKKKKTKKKPIHSPDEDKEDVDECVRKLFSPFSVRFRNELLYKRYGPRILRFLQQIASEPDFPIAATEDEPFVMEIHGSFSFDVDRKDESEEVDPDQPVYEMHYKEVLQEGEVQEDKTDGAGARLRQKSTCFNCLGAHTLKECKEKKNFQVINENRMEFVKNKNATPKSLRYHVELDSEKDVARPGMVSDRLREAMELEAGHLPLYIYRMRVLGYPPGWLEEAKSETSGLAIINNVKEDDAEPEEIKVQYDFTKIHSYPGFNVWPPKGTQDQAYAMGFPPMMPHHLKDNWEKQLEGSLYKPTINRSKAPILESSSKKTPNRDSPTGSSIPEGFATPRRRGPMLLPPCKSTATSNDRVDSRSPSLDELEEKKRILMEELETPTKAESVDKSPSSVNLGTPIPTRKTAEQQIPGFEKFSKSITDYIPFENLPGYTGKYSQLNKLLKKVRSKVKDLNSSLD